MALTMTRPTKHRKTGVYWLRKAIPAPLRDAAKTVLGVGHELKISLGTKDESDARKRAPEALAGLEAKLEAVRGFVEGGMPRITEKQVHALAGAWYRHEAAKWADDPGTMRHWGDATDQLADQAERLSADDVTIQLSPEDRADATRELLAAGLPIFTENVERVGQVIWGAKMDLARAMQRRAEGDWREDRNLSRFPTLAPATASTMAPSVSLDALLASWARDSGYSLTDVPKVRQVYDRERTLERLAGFLGHRDAAVVTKTDAVRWKVEMQERDLKVATIRNDISEMSAIWKHAIRQDMLGPDAINPFEKIAPPKPKRRALKDRQRPFTDEEARAILTAARAEKGLLRWLPWVCCLTGSRLAEVVQAYKEDVVVLDGITALRIHTDAAEHEDGVRSVKNEDSIRTIPLHPDLIAEGFLDYVDALPARSPLFPDAKPDKMFGLRSTNAGKKVSRWLKEELKVTDPTISPNHSWRHWFIDACRKEEMNTEVRSALTGHSGGGDESARYGHGMRVFLPNLAKAIGLVKPPLEPLGRPQATGRP